MKKLVDSKMLGLIQSSAIRQLGKGRLETVNLYVMHEIQKKGSSIPQGHTEIKFKRPTVFVFIDEEPLANWSHECRFLLFDPESGKQYNEVRGLFAPYMKEIPKTYEGFHTPVSVHNPMEKRWYPKYFLWHQCPLRLRDGERYAILYSGHSNNRHTNDMEFLYRVLIDRYYFNPANIVVLNYDGTLNYSGWPTPVSAWPGDGSAYTMPVDGPGSRQAFDDVVDALKSKLTQKDLLLIHTNNHGSHNGTESYIFPYSGPVHTVTQFADKIAELPAYADLMVMMEQCNSGGFNDAVIENSTATRTTFSAACTERKSSIGGANFDPYASDWVSALAGVTPFGAALQSNPDHNSNNETSAREAFAYSDEVHHSYDSPVYSAYGVDAGGQSLNQRWRWIWLWCRFITFELERLYLELDNANKFREIMRTRILPALAHIDDKYSNKPQTEKKAEQLIKETIRSAL